MLSGIADSWYPRDSAAKTLFVNIRFSRAARGKFFGAWHSYFPPGFCYHPGMSETAPIEVPLAPPRQAQPARPNKLEVRIWSAFIFAVCASMLGLGLYLTPDPRGFGTHQQLGLPPCGFQSMFGIPCPTCSCTTAVSHFSHGQLIASFITQPFGFYVALVAFVTSILTFLGLITGRWYGPSMFTLAWYWKTWFFSSVGILLVAWGYKILLVRLGH